jgi:hypothetical protein
MCVQLNYITERGYTLPSLLIFQEVLVFCGTCNLIPQFQVSTDIDIDIDIEI